MFELDICECSGVVLEATHVMVLDCIIIDDCEQLYDHRHKDVVSTAVTVIQTNYSEVIYENLKSLNLLIEVMVTISIDGNIY